MAFSVAQKTKEAKEGVVSLLTSLVGVSNGTASTIAARLPAKECKLLLTELRAIEFRTRPTVDLVHLHERLDHLDPVKNSIGHYPAELMLGCIGDRKAAVDAIGFVVNGCPRVSEVLILLEREKVKAEADLT